MPSGFAGSRFVLNSVIMVSDYENRSIAPGAGQLPSHGFQRDERNCDLRIAQAVCVPRNLAHDHGDFVAIGELGAIDAVLVDLIGQVLALGGVETEVAEKTGCSGEEANAADGLPS